MKSIFSFDPDVLRSIAGGRSALEISKLNFKENSQVESFIQCYGFDYNDHHTQEKLWYFYRRAFVLLTEKLGYAAKDIPEVFHSRKELKDLRSLFLWASDAQQPILQRWSCAFLRTMHVFVHAESDLFSFFSEEIQKQILGPYQKIVFTGGNEDQIFLKSNKDNDDIKLKKFEIKPFKTSSSTVIKLLARPDALAMKVFDKIGVRFVTESLFDAFRVVQYLANEHILSYMHIMPDQSSNNLFSVENFLSICKKFEHEHRRVPDEEISLAFAAHEAESDSKLKNPELFRKENQQSGQEFKFIKFIARQLVEVKPQGQVAFNFFYPYEVQIMDQKAYAKILSGPSEHNAYKERQRDAARNRLFPGGS